MRRTLAVGVAVLLVAVIGGPAPVDAADGTACSFVLDVSLDPGVSASPGTGTFTSNGETGTADCGFGPGTLGMAGDYGTKDPDSCNGAFNNGNEGRGMAALKVPTADGPQSADFPFTFVYGQRAPDGMAIAGTFESERFSGTLRLIPTSGDCMSVPVTRARVSGQGTFR
jgi:hypothetical protein